MATNIEQLFDARRQLVAWASHDLRAPLASLRAMIEALEDDLASTDEYLPAIRQQLETLTVLVEDLFELARIDAGVLALDVQDASLADLISGCLRGLDAEARVRNIKLEAHLGPDDPRVRIAPAKIERVLVVSIEDTGPGLEAGATERMFERFWRADDSRTRSSGGAGLGLAIAQGLVHAHGGTIWAENRPLGGARVAFTLPLAKA
jgi:signal transduction histidine kinase